MLRGHGVAAGRPGRHPAAAAARDGAWRIWRSTSMGAIALPLFTQFGPDALEHRLQHSGARGADHRCREHRARSRRSATPCRISRASSSSAAAGASRSRGRRWHGLRRFTPLDTARRRPGADHLHLRHDRKAQGRAACPPRPARPSAGRADCRRSSSRSRATCSGRRPTGPGPAGCSTCCCRACISACRCWPRAPANSIRKPPST